MGRVWDEVSMQGKSDQLKGLQGGKWELKRRISPFYGCATHVPVKPRSAAGHTGLAQLIELKEGHTFFKDYQCGKGGAMDDVIQTLNARQNPHPQS